MRHLLVAIAFALAITASLAIPTPTAANHGSGCYVSGTGHSFRTSATDVNGCSGFYVQARLRRVGSGGKAIYRYSGWHHDKATVSSFTGSPAHSSANPWRNAVRFRTAGGYTSPWYNVS